MNYDVMQLIAGNPANIIAGAWEDFVMAGALANVNVAQIGGAGTTYALSTSAILASSPAGHGVIAATSGTSSGDGYKVNLTSHAFAIREDLGPIAFATRFQVNSTNARVRFGLSTAALSAEPQSANDYIILDIGSATKQIQYRANGGTAVGVDLPSFTFAADTWMDFLVLLHPIPSGSSSRMGFEIYSQALGIEMQGRTALTPHPLAGLADAMNFSHQVTNGTAAAIVNRLDYLGVSQRRRS